MGTSPELELADVTRWHVHLHASSTPMMLVDDERRRVEVNAAACNLLGRSREELLGMRLEDLVPADTRPRMEALWERFPHLGWLIGELVVLDGTGHPLEVEFVGIANVLAGVHLVILHSSRPCPCAVTSPVDDRLTDAERRAVSLVAMGMETHEIARRLNVSLEVVLAELDRAMSRLGARNLSHLVAIVVQRGLVTAGSSPRAEPAITTRR